MTVKVPFQKKLDDLFQGDRTIWLKMGGGAFVGAFIGATVLERVSEMPQGLKVTPVGVALSVTIGALFGAALVAMLALKDSTRRRIEQGQGVYPIFRLFFAAGAWSILFWGVAVTLITLIVTLFTAPHR
jgi:hypothetical protein